jgi:hypothetical protein
MRTVRNALFGLLGISSLALVPSRALAQESNCATIYTSAELDTAIDEAQRLLDNADITRAGSVLRKTRDVIPCLETLAERERLGRFGRLMALVSFYEQDEVQATRWGRMFVLTAPDMGWGDLPEGHPLVQLIEDAGLPVIGGPTDQDLVVPKKGAVFMNGSIVFEPEAHAEVPYLVQVFNKNGWPVDSFWQDGSAFPDRLLSSEVEAPKAPSFYDEATNTVTQKGKPPVIEDEFGGGSDFPVLTTAAAGGLIVVGGVLYALAGTQHARVKCDPRDKDNCPTTPEQLAGAQTAANWLVLGSGIAFAGGVGLGVSGFLLDGDQPTGIVINGRF